MIRLLLLLMLFWQQNDLETRARAIVTAMFAGDVSAAEGMLHPAPPAGVLKQARDQITAQAGGFKSISSVRFETMQGVQVATVAVAFEKATLSFAVPFNSNAEIIGFRVAPNAPPVAWSAPSYADPQKFKEQALTLGAAPWELPAVLTLPSGTGPFPAVVLVHGSGPGDEDETIAANKPFKDLAWGLASNGIAVLRYKKRTLVHGAQMTQGTLTVMEETVIDARSAIELLAKTPAVDAKRIYVLGHSLGGMLAPRIAANSTAAGIVIMSGNVRPLEDLMVEQIEYLSGAGLAPVSALEAARQNRKEVQDPNLTATSRVNFAGAVIPGSYWLDLRSYKPGEAAAALKIPMMIMRGDRDYQVGATDYDAWKTALKNRTDVTFKLYPSLNHLFISGSGPATPQEYSKPGHVDSQVILDIANWITAKKR